MKEGWTYKKLGEVGDVVTGSTPSTKDEENYNSDDICFVKPSDLPKEGIGLLSETEFHITNKAYSNSRKLPKVSVLTTCI
jgi:type I restriction enzyme S subunit